MSLRSLDAQIVAPWGGTFPTSLGRASVQKEAEEERGEAGEVALLRYHLCPCRLGNFTYHIPVSSSTPLHLSLTLQMK